MTGTRSWLAAATAFGVVVRIEQVSTIFPVGSFHLSQIPANANSAPSLTSKQYGCLALPVFCVCGNKAPTKFQRIAERSSNVLLLTNVSNNGGQLWRPLAVAVRPCSLNPQQPSWQWRGSRGDSLPFDTPADVPPPSSRHTSSEGG